MLLQKKLPRITSCILLRWSRIIAGIIAVYGMLHQVCAFDPLLDKLPLHPRELLTATETETLDSLTLLLLSQWYSEPLNVPSGELSLLLELFPELGNYLPQRSDLEHYEPWDQASQTRLLDDFPVVKNYLPVLTFRFRSKKNTAAVDFYVRRRSVFTAANTTARFSLHKPTLLDAGGTVDVTDDYARWERRTFSFTPVTWCTLSGGNRQLFYDEGLVYGYFRSDSNSTTDIAENWKYASVPGWNGLAAEVQLPDFPQNRKVTLGAFVHKRKPESVTGSSITLAEGDMMTGTIGYTQLDVHDSGKGGTRHTLHGMVTGKLPSLTAELQTAIDPTRWDVPPVQLVLRYRQGDKQLMFDGVHLPAGYDAPASAYRRSFAEEMEVDRDTLAAGLTRLRLVMRTQKHDGINLTPGLRVWLSNAAVHHASLQMSALQEFKKVRARMSGIYRFGGDSYTRERGDLQGELTWDAFPFVTLATEHRIQFTGETITQYVCGVTSEAVWRECLTFEPSLKIITRNDAAPLMLAGCTQRLHLFGRMFTRFTFEQSGAGGQWEWYRIAAAASFVF